MTTSVVRLPTALACIAIAPLLLPGCRASRDLFGLERESGARNLPSGRLEADEAAAQLAALEADLDRGAPRVGIDRALALREVENLSPEDRNRTEELLEASVRAWVEAAERARDLEGLRASKLPRLPRAVLELGRARLDLDEGRPFEAFGHVRSLELVHPTHPLQTEAAEIVYRSGIELASSTRRTLLLFRDRSRAPAVLDYLVLQHPTHPSCDHAYFVLADQLAANGSLQRAIDRLDELLLYHPTSPYALEAEVRIPQLRMADHLRVDYDRAELVRARRELDTWLARHGGAEAGSATAELEQEVRDLLAECVSRLAESDLLVASFYDTVERSEGAVLHAERALALARQSGDDELVARAEQRLEDARALGLAEAEGRIGDAPEVLGSAADAADAAAELEADSDLDATLSPGVSREPKPLEQTPDEAPPIPPDGELEGSDAPRDAGGGSAP